VHFQFLVDHLWAQATEHVHVEGGLDAIRLKAAPLRLRCARHSERGIYAASTLHIQIALECG
jgi:hypothetical protein